MQKIRLTKEIMEESFLKYLDEIFDHPEIISACAKGIAITRETAKESGHQAFEACFHDNYSDIDLTLKVSLPKDGSVTAEEYLKRVDRFGVTEDNALGWMFVPVNYVCRVVFKNGMRYDLCFEFVFDGEVDFNLGSCHCKDENPNWPVDNINRFWFIEVQALGKLYRKDNLISAHLANMNCNDTLVMQMILRDLKYSTSHHRYGYSEQPEYTLGLGKIPYKTDDEVFNRIADHIYAAALAYDRLVTNFYPEYKSRSDLFFAIWDCYDSLCGTVY